MALSDSTVFGVGDNDSNYKHRQEAVCANDHRFETVLHVIYYRRLILAPIT